MKKILTIFVITLSIFMLSGCTRARKSALEFKEEYESVNDRVMRDDIKYRTLNIKKDNPYVKVEAKDIVEKIQNGETFYLYVGDPLCPWCRSGLEKMIDVAISYGIKDIYYIDFWDDDHNETLRDIYEVQMDGKKAKIVKTQEAIAGYENILNAVKNFAQDYTITYEGKTYNVGEKRIYGGDHFYFEKGVCTKYVSLRSSKLEKSTDELTPDVINDQQKKFSEFFTSSTCDDDHNC